LKKLLVYERNDKAKALCKFDSFRSQYIHHSEKIYSSYKELLEDAPEADVYIAESDQVLNPDLLSFKHTKNQVKAYFLDF
jgi:hypothetical protein